MSVLCTLFGACLTITGLPYVQDGDTIILKNQQIRIFGLDAEELHEPNGRAARAALIRIVKDAPVTCKHTGDNSHKRIVARCHTSEGKDIAELMVRDAAALDCRRFSGGMYSRFEPAGVRSRLQQKPYCDPNFRR